MRPEVASAVEAAIDALGALDPADAFDPGAPAAIVAAGVHRLCVPAEAGGFGATLAESAEVLAAIGAVDGSTALGLAMQTHVVGAMRDSASFSPAVRAQLYAAIVDEGALVNNAATEEGGGSPARGAIPGTVATGSDAAGWHLRGEKTWTTWLPALRYAFVTAQLTGPGEEAASREVGTFLVDLAAADGVDRQPAFAALGMRGSASGRLILDGTPGVLVQRRPAGGPDPRGAAPGTWFAIAVGAAYLGVGEGARSAVARWALDRRPGDGSSAVADIPTVQLRLGRLDADLRTARIVVLDAARRWDASGDGGDAALAKLVATRAAAAATDEALRIAGGPGFLAGPLERAFRDARAGLINPPLEDVALLGFGRAVLDRERR